MTKILIERKPRVRQIHGVKGDAVVCYCESLTTKEMTYHRPSRRVNKLMNRIDKYSTSIEEIQKLRQYIMEYGLDSKRNCLISLFTINQD